jgi:hypothetical protein
MPREGMLPLIVCDGGEVLLQLAVAVFSVDALSSVVRARQQLVADPRMQPMRCRGPPTAKPLTYGGFAIVAEVQDDPPR